MRRSKNRAGDQALSRRDLLQLTLQGFATMALLNRCASPTQRNEGESTPMPNTREATSIPSLSPEPPAPSPAPISLDAKIGQMLMVGFRGLEVDDDHFIVKDIRQRHLGGVVLFDYDVPTRQAVRNVASPSQVKALVDSLQSIAAQPLLVAIDHEGGRVTRLKEQRGFPPTVSHQHLGALNDLEQTYAQAASMAESLAAVGINLNLAPVVDLCLNPNNPIIARLERCFSADPQVVAGHALRFIQAHRERGVGCTLKHFPGHGSSGEDSHVGLVDVTESWSPIELEPYRSIIHAGQADAIMTGHVFNAQLDIDFPATLSHATLSDLLRNELGYDGVVISDDMQMAAIADSYGFDTAIQKALEAGVDILAFANNSVYEEDVATRANELIRRLVENDVIGEERILASYERIQRLKSKIGILTDI